MIIQEWKISKRKRCLSYLADATWGQPRNGAVWDRRTNYWCLIQDSGSVPLCCMLHGIFSISYCPLCGTTHVVCSYPTYEDRIAHLAIPASHGPIVDTQWGGFPLQELPERGTVKGANGKNLARLSLSGHRITISSADAILLSFSVSFEPEPRPAKYTCLDCSPSTDIVGFI
jgi:hypothetical protein